MRASTVLYFAAGVLFMAGAVAFAAGTAMNGVDHAQAADLFAAAVLLLVLGGLAVLAAFVPASWWARVGAALKPKPSQAKPAEIVTAAPSSPTPRAGPRAWPGLVFGTLLLAPALLAVLLGQAILSETEPCLGNAFACEGAEVMEARVIAHLIRAAGAVLAVPGLVLLGVGFLRLHRQQAAPQP